MENKIINEENCQSTIKQTNNSNLDRLKGFIGISLHSCLFHGGWLAFVYMIYQIAFKQNLKHLGYITSLYIYQFLIAKKSEAFLKLFQYFDPTKWYDTWEEIVEEEPSQGTLFPFHPHSIYCLSGGLSLNKVGSVFHKNNTIALGASPLLLATPVGIQSTMMGLQKVVPKNFERLMQEKQNIIFSPGGFEEATITHNKNYRIFLKTRQGFIKYALQYGYNIQPVFVFNENKHFYWSPDYLMNFRLLLNKFKIPGTFYLNPWGIIPGSKSKMQIVVGKSIKCPLIQEPTREDVEKYHLIYIEELKQLFNRHVEKYDPGAKLIIFDDIKPEQQKQLTPKL